MLGLFFVGGVSWKGKMLADKVGGEEVVVRLC